MYKPSWISAVGEPSIGAEAGASKSNTSPSASGTLGLTSIVTGLPKNPAITFFLFVLL